MTSILNYEKRKAALDKRIRERQKTLKQRREESKSKEKARKNIVSSARSLRRLRDELEIFIKVAKETHGRVDKLVRKVEKEYWI